MRTSFAILTLTFVLSIMAAPSAHADGHKKSSLIISDEVYTPKKEMAHSETDMMPITEEVEQQETIVIKQSHQAQTAPTQLTPMPGNSLTVEHKPLIIKPKTDVVTVMSWRGRSGETVQEVLTRWGGRVGENYHWKTQDTSQLHRNFSYFGEYEDAVQKLLVREVKSENYIEEYTHTKGNLYTGLKKNY